MKVKGKVRWFNVNRGFGFIELENDSTPIYVHHTGIENGRHFVGLGAHDEVELEIGENDRGRIATKVSLINPTNDPVLPNEIPSENVTSMVTVPNQPNPTAAPEEAKKEPKEASTRPLAEMIISKDARPAATSPKVKATSVKPTTATTKPTVIRRPVIPANTSKKK